MNVTNSLRQRLFDHYSAPVNPFILVNCICVFLIPSGGINCTTSTCRGHSICVLQGEGSKETQVMEERCEMTGS